MWRARARVSATEGGERQRMSFETIIAADAADVARQIAGRIQALAAAVTGARLAVALSGGSTPKRLYELLAAPPFRDRIDWSAIELFFGDERAVPQEHSDSNYRMIHEALLSKVPVTAHGMPAEAGDAAAYERLLRERIPSRSGVPMLDLVLLGVGSDGHTASLFPGTSALDEHARLVVMNDVPQLGTTRMTVTYPLLNAARRVWVLVPGADKRDIVRRCLAARAEPGGTARFPILGVRPDAGELIWWLDDASGGRPAPRV
jgi:6-phosphogluconolactonase